MAWTTALGLAAWPTLEEWWDRSRPDASTLYSCAGEDGDLGVVDGLLSPVRGDLGMLVEDVEAFAVPALVVVAAFLGCVGRGGARRTGWRAAACLGGVAVVLPVVPVYGDPESCGVLPILSRGWIAAVVDAWGWTQVCLLGAAALVVVASRTVRVEGGAGWRRVVVASRRVPEEGGAAGGAGWRRAVVASRTVRVEGGVGWRRVVAVVVDYVVLLVGFSVVVQVSPVLSDRIYLGYGVLNAVCLLTYFLDPLVFGVAGVVFVYFWGQHLRWGRTLGKRLLGVGVVAADGGGPVSAGRLALRTAVFPGLVLVPWAGPLVLVVVGVGWLVDPEGRMPHDRMAGTVAGPWGTESRRDR